jgi:hypothetical protein
VRTLQPLSGRECYSIPLCSFRIHLDIYNSRLLITARATTTALSPIDILFSPTVLACKIPECGQAQQHPQQSPLRFNGQRRHLDCINDKRRQSRTHHHYHTHG